MVYTAIPANGKTSSLGIGGKRFSIKAAAKAPIYPYSAIHDIVTLAIYGIRERSDVGPAFTL